ncbi:MAG: hypothetical protein ACOY4Q_10270 [Bacillota bacterium]
MQDSVWLYRIYDISDEFNLSEVESLLAREKPTGRMRLTRVRPKSIHIENPPVAVELGKEKINLAGREFTGVMYAKIFGLGVVSLTLRLAVPAGFDYEELKKLSIYLYTTEELEPLFQGHLHTLSQVLANIIIPTKREGFIEDFTLFYFRHWDHSHDPVPLLLAENEPVSQQVRDDTLKNSFSFGSGDLAIITWDTALVYDAEGSTDVPDLIEFALTQLLELRYYDGLLSEELDVIYDSIEEADRAGFYFRLSDYRKITRKLLRMVADVTELTEKIQNSIKVTEDVFYARVYGAALSIFRTQSWSNSIQHKISVIRDTYDMLSGEIYNQRSLLVELAIVFLIVLEIVLGLLRLL